MQNYMDVQNHRISRCLRINLSYQQGKQVLFQRVHHVVMPCFYISPEQINQTLTLERAFRVKLQP